MKATNITALMKTILSPRSSEIEARIFVSREDGITVYDSIQNETTNSVAALVSGVWQASEAMMGMVHPNQDVMDFRLSFDTSSQGIYLFPFSLMGKRYFMGTIYTDCLNPGQLKRQVTLIKNELELLGEQLSAVEVKSIPSRRAGYLFQDITDEEMDRLFAVGGR